LRSTRNSYDVSRTALESWIHLVRTKGYDSVYDDKKRGRLPKAPMVRPKKKKPQTELEKLQAEIFCLKPFKFRLRFFLLWVSHRIFRWSSSAFGQLKSCITILAYCAAPALSGRLADSVFYSYMGQRYAFSNIKRTASSFNLTVGWQGGCCSRPERPYLSHILTHANI